MKALKYTLVAMSLLLTAVQADQPLSRSEKLLLDIARLVVERLAPFDESEPTPAPPIDPIPEPVPTPDPTPVPTPTPIPPDNPGEMENPPAGATLVTNVVEFKAALSAFKPVIAVQVGVYDMGPNEWTIDYYNPTNIRILGGYDANWQRPKVLPSPLAQYNPATGDTILPARLQAFLNTGLGETVITRSSYPAAASGAAVWGQIRGELNRVTLMGSRDPATAQPYVIQGGARLTTLFKDVMTVQRYNNSHAYLTFNYFGGEGAVIDGGIFYQPFVGNFGNCRPQFLCGSGDDPAQIYNQHVEIRNTSLLMPINGGYHRLGLYGGNVILDNCQFLSPAGAGYLNLNDPMQLGVIAADQPGTPDVDWRTEWRNNLIVIPDFAITPFYTRKFLTSGNTFHCRRGMDHPNAALWADQALDFGATNTIHTESGAFFPPAGATFQQSGAPRVSRVPGYYKRGPVWRDDGKLYNLPIYFPGVASGDSAGFTVNPTVSAKPFKPVRYVHLTITPEQLHQRLANEGEIGCVNVFDEQYPALKHIP